MCRPSLGSRELLGLGGLLAEVVSLGIKYPLGEYHVFRKNSCIWGFGCREAVLVVLVVVVWCGLAPVFWFVTIVDIEGFSEWTLSSIVGLKPWIPELMNMV